MLDFLASHWQAILVALAILNTMGTLSAINNNLRIVIHLMQRDIPEAPPALTAGDIAEGVALGLGIHKTREEGAREARFYR